MRNKKFLALALVAAMMLVGAGYAAWTDGVQATTVIETGEFKVDLETVFSRVWVENSKGAQWIAGDNDNAYALKPVANNNTVEFEFKNLYPGTEAFTQWYARNNGTVNAIVNNIDVNFETKMDVDATRTLEEKLEVRGSIQLRDKDNNRLRIIGGIPKGTKLSELENILEEILVGEMIKPGETISFAGNGSEGEATAQYMYFTVPTSLKGNEGENEILELKITIDFIQYNLYEEAAPSDSLR